MNFIYRRVQIYVTGGRGVTETYDIDPDQPRTATAEDSIDNDVLKRPKNYSKRKDENRCLVLVIAGRAGVGKSTVLNNLNWQTSCTYRTCCHLQLVWSYLSDLV